MKRKLLHAVLVASMAVALSGCGNTSGINADAEKTQKATETENIEEERGTEVAAAEQKENTTGTPDENGNYLINGSFEEPDFSGWTVTNNNDVTEELDVYDRETDCFAGAQSLHFYSGNNPVDFSMKQTVSGLEDGTYKLTAHIQGDAAGDENPIYEGDMLQQRTYTETRFPFVRRVNNGQRNQYLIKDSHPPIVTHEEAEAVRNLMAYRVDVLHMNKSDYTKRYLFSGRIICGECGRTFRRQKIYIGKPYEKIIWTCSGHVEDKESCCMKAIREDVLHRAFTDMWNKLYTNQGTILEPLLKELTELVAARQDSEEIRQLDKEIKDISGQSQILNQVMRKGYMDSALFMESSNKLGWQLTECRRKKTLLTRKLRRTKEIVRTEQLIQLIAEQDGLREEFDEQLFKMTAEKIVVSKEHDITFCLHNGLKLTERGGRQDAVAHANRL